MSSTACATAAGSSGPGNDTLRPTIAPRTFAPAAMPAANSVKVLRGSSLDGPPSRIIGIVVASAPGYWGAEAGPGFDLAGARALVFRARGENGGERIRVKAAVAGDQPFGDTASLPLDSGWLTLGSDWQEFRIDAAGRDLSRVVTPFLVMANDKHNPGGRITVFLDDIRYERGG